jgi:uncharacterized LabA/DUF88 family protein
VPRAFVYIDGLNLYYGAVKGTPYKWLDLFALCSLLLPRDDILKVRYFTARVKPRPWDPGAPERQEIYLRALRTIPNLSIHLGHFLVHEVSMPEATPTTGPPRTVRVIKTEEKGSDVNLATYLLLDGFRNEYETAAVLTNDSDLLEPVRVVRQELGHPVWILSPHERTSQALLRHASSVRKIRRGALARCQFPDQLSDQKGTFRKPAAW